MSEQRPPAQPAYVLRGHSAQIHAIHFVRNNSRLLTGDGDGFVVIWSTTTKRPVVVWKAHAKSILGLGSWEQDKIITHGRDNKLLVWRLPLDDEPSLSTTLPIDDPSSAASHKQPWLLHSLDVNALNFCSFAMIHAEPHAHSDLPSNGIFIATPGVQDGHVNITSLPDEQRLGTIPAPESQNTGMTMALGLSFRQSDSLTHVRELVIVAGYESGHACAWQQKGAQRAWALVYCQKLHSQPILSLSIASMQRVFFTSSADAIIARHPFGRTSAHESSGTQTKHAGQQGLQVRSDERVFATAGWDGRVRVYSVKTCMELAVLKWHKEGCYALAFAETKGSSEAESSEERSMTVSERREQVATTTHWLAAGSKDGKVSLWDIY